MALSTQFNENLINQGMPVSAPVTMVDGQSSQPFMSSTPQPSDTPIPQPTDIQFPS